MADITKIQAIKNKGVAFAPLAAATSQTIPMTEDAKMIIYVKNGSASAVTLTIPKGNGICSVQGDYLESVAAAAERIIGPLESARFVDTVTGKVTVNLSAAASVTIAVVQLP